VGHPRFDWERPNDKCKSKNKSRSFGSAENASLSKCQEFLTGLLPKSHRIDIWQRCEFTILGAWMKGLKMIYSIRQMTRYLMLAVTSVFAFHAMPLEATAQSGPENSGLRLYDNFRSPNIDPLRWYTTYSCDGKTTMECIRQIENGSLHLRARAYGDRTVNAGTEYGNAEFSLVDPSATDIAVELTVLHEDMSPCVTSSGAGTHGHAILYGNFFNDGSGASSGDTTALLALDRVSGAPSNQIQAGAFLQYQGVFYGFVVLGYFNVGEPVRIELKWDKSHRQFLASFTPLVNNSTVTVALPYTSSDSAPAYFPEKAIGVRAFPENCTGVPTYVDIEAAFDRVLVN